MLRKIVGLTLFICSVLSSVVVGQTGIIGDGFSSGWTNPNDIVYSSSSAGNSRIIIRNPTAAGGGTKYFRLVRNNNIEMSPSVSCSGGEDQDISSNAQSVISINNAGYCSNGAWYINCPNSTDNYVFKLPSENASSNFVYFRVQGAIRNISSVAQAPLAASVFSGQNVTITAGMDGIQTTGQNVYLRYSTNNWATSMVIPMTYTGTNATATIPNTANTAGTTIRYYVFTSGTANVESDGSNADFYTINLNNSGGSNYSYTVLNPNTIYFHDFGTSTSYTHPFTVVPNTFATGISNSRWINTNSAWASVFGSSGQAISLSNSGGTPTITLTFDIAAGYAVSVSSFNFWRQRSTTGAQNWSMTINGIAVGSGTATTSGTVIGVTNVSNAVNNLTGTVTIIISLSGATGTGSFRLDDFTLNGNVVALPGAPSNNSDIIDNTAPYSGLSPEFNSNPSYILFTDGSASTTGKIIPMKFKIRDGGAGLNDADNLPTTLTGITFNVTNTAGTNRGNFIKQAILTTSGGTVIGTASSITTSQIIFTGLSDAAFTVADNTETATNLHLRIAFDEANVIDNEKLVFTVAAATAGAGSSIFYYPNAGGAQTDNLTSIDRNRIEVIATALAFVQQPGNTGFGQTMTPNPTVQAIDANGKRDLDFANGIVLTSSGTMTGAPITVNANSGLATYTSVVHTAVQTGVQLTASYTGLTSAVSNTFNVAATSGTTDHFRTAAGFTSGDWNTINTWESSPDNTTWAAATQIPNSAASSVTIRSGTVTVSTPQSAKLLTIQAGGTLQHNTGVIFTIADDGTANHDFVVQGRYEINGEQPTFYTGASGIIYTNAEVRAKSNAGSPGTSDDFARNTIITWQNNAVFNWSTTDAFQTSGETYFPNTPEGTIPVFKISATTTVGANSSTTINGVVEIAPSVNANWNNTGDKIFRNGIIGSGNLLQQSNCGRFVINGATSVLGISSAISLRNDVVSGLVLQSGVCTILNNTIINTGPFSLSSGATLIAGSYVVSGSSSFTLNSNATLSSAHANGVNGNITVSATKNFISGSNYIFNGIVNQTTGALMASSTGTLTIANTGTAGNNLVTLTNNNTSTNALNLNSGLFAAGVGQVLRINSGGIVNGTGGHVSTNSNGEGGTIEFVAIGAVNGTPNLWNVQTAASLDFANNAPIFSQLILNAGAFITNAPRYQSGSTLIYRTGGPYARNVEWGNTAGLPGYPHHVTVDGNTIVDLFTNGITPATLAIGGNLQLGGSNGYGRMYLNNNMDKPLEVLGNVTIGSGDLASENSVLALEDSQPGGDLILHGNFTRYVGSTFSGYTRALFLKGAGNSSIQVLPQPPASSGTVIDQPFPFVFIQKSNPDAEISMNCTIGVSEQLDLTGNGLISSTTGNYLVITNKNSNAIVGGSANSFVNGPLIRRTENTANNYHYPVGKKTIGGRIYRPLRFSTMNNLGNGDEFTGEYFAYTDATPSAGQDVLFGSTIGGILKNEYWQFDRILSSSATGKLAITYQYPGSANEWRDASGASSPPCTECNVAVVKRSTNSGNPGNWNFTKADYNFDVYDPTYPEARYYNQSGFIQSGEINTFSPFTIGFNFNTILGTLPVKLLAFDGSMQQQQAKLQWQIDSDKDVRYFELQHSSNGNTFTTVNKLNPAGKNYVASHTPGSAGKQFYRLKVVEKNGSSFYSKTIVLIAGNSATFISGLQNSVVTQQVVVNMWLQQNQAVQTSLYNAAGKQLTTQLHQLLRGDNQLTIPTQHLSQGIYFLQVQTADGVRQTFRMFKQ